VIPEPSRSVTEYFRGLTASVEDTPDQELVGNLVACRSEASLKELGEAHPKFASSLHILVALHNATGEHTVAWQALASELRAGKLSIATMTALILVEVLRKPFDDLANEGNRVWSQFEFSRARIRDKNRGVRQGSRR
jgi:hypothetical protein